MSSIFRVKNRIINQNVLLDNRLNNFTIPPMRIGDLIVERNEYVNGNLDVSGNLNIRNNLTAKNIYATGSVDVCGNVVIHTDLSVNNVYVTRNLDISGNVNIDYDLSVNNISARGNVDVCGNVNIDDDLYVDNIYAKGNVNVDYDLYADNMYASGDLDVSRNVNIDHDLSVDNIHASGDLDVSGNVNVDKDLSVDNIYARGNYYLDNYILIPAGTIIQSAAVTTPNGWLSCNGQSITVAQYQNLYNAILYTFGGSGSNFNVPDLRGRVPIGSGAGAGLTSRALASTGGEENHTLTTGEMPVHDHGSNAVGGNIGLITSTGDNTQNGSVNSTPGEPDLYAGLPALDIYNTGSGLAHNNMQPFLVLNYLIKY